MYPITGFEIASMEKFRIWFHLRSAGIRLSCVSKIARYIVLIKKS
jgi:hypothetical protein